ncbi:MAG: hypothetical protein NC831_09385, partial [Candidatus Omnitrophica bacterium]|nr:hypothetical protein [Candidatus Omnitrophota bacterium]
MQNLFSLILKHFDFERWQNLSLKIYSIERRFCYQDFEKSAKLCKNELEHSGAKNVELISLKADGKTTYGD